MFLLLFLVRVTSFLQIFKVLSQFVEAARSGFVVDSKLGADLAVVRSLGGKSSLE
jgi:hypothetical protein